MKNIKRSYIIIFILFLLVLVSIGVSYAFFTSINEEHGKLNIVAGTLNYKIESEDLINNKITIDANSGKELTIKLTSLNKIDSKYELYYTLSKENSNIIAGYNSNSKDSVVGTIKSDETKEITIIIINNGEEAETVTIDAIGGLIKNNLVLSVGKDLNQPLELPNTLNSLVLQNNKVITAQPTLTTSSNNTSDASGLYKSTDTNTGDATYYFRGAVENNYVSFAGFTWRIIRINEDGTIRMIMQDGINNNASYAFNSNYNNYTYIYYSNSEVKTTLENWYQTNIGSKSDLSKYVVSGNYYCEQAKVKYEASWTAGNASMTLYSSYTPNFKCSTDGNGKGQVNASIGLPTYDEVVYAGGYKGSANSDYYLSNNSNFWTMSPDGFSGAYSLIWYVGSNGIYDIRSYQTRTVRPVINLKANTFVIMGSGTSDNPYVINQKISNAILNNNKIITNEPTITTSSNNTSDASGLYKSTATNTGDATYYFRGAVENNYVSFAGFTWRIVRINEDGTIRMVMQEGINNNDSYVFNSNYNNYTYMYYSNSNAKIQLENWYNNNIGNDSNLSSKVASGNYFCEQAKVKYDTTWTSGNGTMTLYNNYSPDFKCSNDGNSKGLVNANIGLLTYDEVVYAGGYYGKSNNMYYLYNNTYFGTMSPAGFNRDIAVIWVCEISGQITYYSVHSAERIRPVINLKSNTLVTGKGLTNDPYVII